ncbi:MAG TPA: FCD domain-containing protein [Dongiaceae bacterium]|nr:FCD domain-containing protein [Dongiaceae bacterium]
MADDEKSIPTVAALREHSLTGVVQHEIEKMILSGELPPGERLNEKAIADQLSVSRGPVREACRALAELGFVHLIPNRGVFIKRLSKEDAIEVYDLRAGLTGLAASLLAPVITADHVAHLHQFVTEMELAAENGDFAKFYPINVEFHDYIVRATGNGRLMKLYRGLVKEFHLFRSHGLVQRDALLESNREHRDILAALEARDALQSYDVSQRHVSNGKHRMLKALTDLAEEAVPHHHRRPALAGAIE